MKKFLVNIMLAGVLISVPPIFPNTVRDPNSLSNWLSKNFVYQSEEVEHWNTPQETVRDKFGDCDDFGILVEYVLKKLGYRVYLIAIDYYEKDSGHILCIIKHKNKTYSYFSNQFFYGKKYKSIPELLTAHARLEGVKWKKASVIISKKFRTGLTLWWNKK